MLMPDSRSKKERKKSILPLLREALQMQPHTELFVLTREELNKVVELKVGKEGPRIASLKTSCLVFLNHSFSDAQYSLFRRNKNEYGFEVQPLEKMKLALPVEMPVVESIRCGHEHCERCAVVDVHLLDLLELKQPHIQHGLGFFSLTDVQI